MSVSSLSPIFSDRVSKMSEKNRRSPSFSSSTDSDNCSKREKRASRKTTSGLKTNRDKQRNEENLPSHSSSAADEVSREGMAARGMSIKSVSGKSASNDALEKCLSEVQLKVSDKPERMRRR